MKLRRFAKPILATLLAAGLFGAAAAPAVSTPTASPRAHAADTGWGFK
jgi:hypothetical protein